MLDKDVIAWIFGANREESPKNPSKYIERTVIRPDSGPIPLKEAKNVLKTILEHTHWLVETVDWEWTEGGFVVRSITLVKWVTNQPQTP